MVTVLVADGSDCTAANTNASPNRLFSTTTDCVKSR
jgi:hypothetical protein